MVNILQKLQTQQILNMTRPKEQNADELSAIDNSKYVYWEEQKLFFQVRNKKLLIDTKLKKDLLEQWTLTEWRNENVLYVLNQKSDELKLADTNPYLFGNKLDISIDILEKIYGFQLEKSNKKIKHNLGYDVDIDSIKEQNLIDLAQELSPKLTKIIDLHQKSMEKIVNNSRSTYDICRTCNVKSQLIESCEYFEGHFEDSYYRHHTWSDLDYYIYHNLTNLGYNMMGTTMNYRCWFCDMCRETWETDSIQKLLSTQYNLLQEQEKENIKHNIINSHQLIGDFPGLCIDNNVSW